MGRHLENLKKRKTEHIRKSLSGEYNTAFAKAIRKYSEESFKWSIIEELTCSQKELDDREIYWIDFYRCSRVYNGHGYNMTLGGGGTKGLLLNESIRMKMSLSKIGVKHSEERRLNISRGLKGKLSGEKHPMYGKKFTSERRKKISTALMNHPVSNEARLKMSMSHTGKKLSSEHIEKISLRNTKEGNPMWGKSHSVITKEKISMANKGRLSGDRNPSAKRIVQLTKEGIFVNKYTTGLEGALAVSGDLSAVIKCCRGKRKTAYGFRWTYEEDYLKPLSSYN